MRSSLGLVVALVASAAIVAPAHADEKTLMVWSCFGQSTLQKSSAAFGKTNPDPKVKYNYYVDSLEYVTDLEVAAGSNSLADVIWLQPGSRTQQGRIKIESRSRPSLRSHRSGLT